MEKLKEVLGALDVGVKIVIAVAVFVLFTVEKERRDLDKKQVEINQAQQASNLVVIDKIIPLVFEQRNKCMAEDQAFLLDFLIETNNRYNVVKMDPEKFRSASAARRQCSSGPVAEDTEKHQGEVPVATPGDILQIKQQMQSKGVNVQPTRDAGDQQPSGYVAVGTFSPAERSFRNFKVPKDKVGNDGSVAPGAVIEPKWPVYLRANTNNTQQGTNPILGVVNETTCASVIRSFPEVRGQTWAAVKLVNCI